MINDSLKELAIHGMTTGFVGAFMILGTSYIVDKLKHFLNIISK